MSTIWADYSTARPGMAVLKSKGIVGVFRYLAPLPNGKVINTTERDLILNAGLDLILNWEWYEGRCNEGGGAGKADGTEAVRQARALEYPVGACIYFSHDTGVYDWQAIEAYFTAARAACQAAGYAIGAYGSYALIQFLHSKGLIDYGWQTRAWSTVLDPQTQTRVVQWSPFATVRQTGTALVPDTDNDIVLSSDIGSWKGADVALTDADKQWLGDRIDAAAQHVLDDLLGTKNRIKNDVVPGVQSLNDKVTKLQDAVAGLPGGSQDAQAVVDEMGRRLSLPPGAPAGSNSA